MTNLLRSTIFVFMLSAAAYVATAAAAQQQPALSITAVDPSGYPTITAVVTALDANGVPVSGLTAASVRAFEGDAPLTVTELETERLSLSVAVVIDVSGSMQGEAIASARDAAREFVRNLGPADSASVFAFSTAVRQVTPFTGDKAQLAAAIDGLQAAGDTSLFEAAQTAVFALKGVEAPRKAIVLLTDGQNVSPSPVTLEGSLGVVRGGGVPVYSIGFGPGPDASYLQTIAQATNGQYRTADIGSVGAVYGDIARLLDSQYTLTLQAPASALPAGPSTLRIATEIGGQPAEATAAFDRPGPAAPPTVAPVSTAQQGGDGSAAPLIVYGGVVGAILLGIMAVMGGTVFQRTRTRRRQLAVVAPNLGQAAAQPLPQAPGSIVTDTDHGAGRLIALDGAVPRSYDFTSTPLRIGSGQECEVRLAASPEVASRHAVIWMKDGKIMLRHTAGPRRPTLVAGRPVEWIILDPGDEFTVGGQRYRAEAR